MGRAACVTLWWGCPQGQVSAFGVGVPAMSPCPRRATAKDSLESSYFKEKPLRKSPLAGAGGLWVSLTPLPAPLTPSLPHSLRARAHAHLSPPPQQAGSRYQCGDREPGKTHQAMSPGPWGAQRVPAGMAFCCRTAPALPAPPPLGWILNSIPQAGWGSTGIPCPPAQDQDERRGWGPPGCWRGQPCPMWTLCWLHGVTPTLPSIKARAASGLVPCLQP